MSDIALTMVMLSLAGALGLWIGNVKIYRVSLGIGGVLFGGIIVGHLAQRYGLVLNTQIL
ncbi:transporter, partial [Escherichia coli]